MSAGKSLAHTCAQPKGWSMTGLAPPRSMLKDEFAQGFHGQDNQVWNDNCVGNGLTIRNLKRALRQAEDLIHKLKSRSTSTDVDPNASTLRDLNSALESKLLEVQNLLNQRETESRQLRAQIQDHQAGYRELNERIVSLIKKDLWQLPNRVSLPDLQHNENPEAGEWIKHIDNLLTILEDVRTDIHECQRKESERHTNIELEGKERKVTEYQSKINDLTTTISDLKTQLAASHEIRTTLENTLTQIQTDRLSAATRQAEDLKSLENQITELRADIGVFQNEKTKLVNQLQNASTTEANLRGEVELAMRKLDAQEQKIASLESALNATSTARSQSAAQTSPQKDQTATFGGQRFSLKRPLSPTFGVDSTQQASRQSTMEDEIPWNPSQESQTVSQASPTPHLDELFVGGRGTTPKVSTLRVTRTRRKGVNPLIDQPTATQDESAPSTPVADGEKRRTKRTKVAKIA